MTKAEADEDPARLPFKLADHERGRNADALWEAAIGDLRAMVEHEGPAAWDEIVARLRRVLALRVPALQGLVAGRDRVLHGHQLPRGRHAQLARRDPARGPRRRVRGHAGDRRRHGRPAQRVLRRRSRTASGSAPRCSPSTRTPTASTVHFKTESGRFSVTGDYAIVTVPFSVLRTIEVLSRSRAGKQRAIRQLNYHASTKILFQVRERIWERRGRDLRRRDRHRAADPADELPDARPDRRGAACCSRRYTWGQDALQWGAMDEETRLEEALDDVERIHPADPRGVRGRRVARLVQRPLGARGVRDVRARASRPSSRPTSSSPRAGSTSRASTARCTTRGSRARSSRGSGPRRRSTRRPR